LVPQSSVILRLPVWEALSLFHARMAGLEGKCFMGLHSAEYQAVQPAAATVAFVPRPTKMACGAVASLRSASAHCRVQTPRTSFFPKYSNPNAPQAQRLIAKKTLATRAPNACREGALVVPEQGQASPAAECGPQNAPSRLAAIACKALVRCHFHYRLWHIPQSLRQRLYQV